MNKDFPVDLLCMGCMSAKKYDSICPGCGFDEKDYRLSPHHLPLRTILNGKYLIGRVLGEGGFGITYIGWDLNLDLKIAIKEYYPSGFVTRENTTTNTVISYSGEKSEFFQNGRQKFVDEAKRLAKFYSLPGIVSVKDFFLENGTAYIVMEFVEGETLKQYLSRMGGKLPTKLMLELIKPLLNSLMEIHRVGIVHRDISPDNIMLTPQGNIKLIDFGAARDFTDNGNKSHTVMLKPGYAPEEQYRSRGIQGPWTDVYSVAATMYKILTGETPPESLDRVEEDTILPLDQRNLQIPENVCKAIMKALAVRAASRYKTIEEFQDALLVNREDSAKKVADKDSDIKATDEMNSDKNRLSNSNEIFQPYVDKDNQNSIIGIKKVNRHIGKYIGALIAAILLVIIIYKYYDYNLHRSDESDQSSEVTNNSLPTEVAEDSKANNESVQNTVNNQTADNLEQNADSLPYVGNSNGNIVNLGMACKQGDWIYYRGDNESYGYSIYKMKTDFSSTSIIYNATGNFINVVGDWVFFNNYDDFKIYKMRTDGSELTKVCDQSAYQFLIYDGWIYFMDYYGAGMLQKVRTDGGEYTVLSEDDPDYINLDVSKKCIYFRNDSDEGKIYSINMDGTNKIKLCDDNSYDLSYFDGWIYYSNASDSNRIYRVSTDGVIKEKICDNNASNVNVAGGYIYYSNRDDGGTIYKLPVEGGITSKINNEVASYINIIDNNIFYLSGAELYTIDTEGKNNTLVSLLTDIANTKQNIEENLQNLDALFD